MKTPVVLLAVAASCASLAAGSAPSARTPDTVTRRTPADRAGPYDFALGDADRSADAFAARHVAFTAHKSPRATWGKLSSRAYIVTFTSAVVWLSVSGICAVFGAVIHE